MYNCQVCTSPSKPNAKVVKIVIYREKHTTIYRTVFNAEGRPIREPLDRVLREIEKEIKVCQLCHDGHAAGIPLDKLATMHRPKPKVEETPTYGPVHPLTGASPPKEEAQPSKPGRVDFLLANMEEKGKHHKAPPLKAARQRQKVKYENRAKKQQQAKA